MRFRVLASLWAVVTMMVVCSSTPALDRGSPEAQTRRPPKPQPIPFSHKLHAKFVTPCRFCHVLSKSGLDMSFPTATKCMICHGSIDTRQPAIVKLAWYQKENQPIPWVQIYTVPDYVLFSHLTHQEAKITCQACHGPVAQRDVITKEKSTSMESCVDCHNQGHAPVTCGTCHNPNP